MKRAGIFAGVLASPMFRREALKLDVEIRRWKGLPQHVDLRTRLQDNRWKLRAYVLAHHKRSWS